MFPGRGVSVSVGSGHVHVVTAKWKLRLECNLGDRCPRIIMESEHSVSSHLHLDTTEYDRIIRTYIPHYDESRGVQLDLLAAAHVQGVVRIVDLGGGTGSLAEAILERFPQA